jgi:hypothetical protein
MGIDIYAKWRNQSEAEQAAQTEGWLSVKRGRFGYLREAYHGEPYATDYFCPEAFEPGGANIPADVLKKRLPHTLALAEERERKLYKSSEVEIEEVKQSYRDFAALCEEKEKETGEAVHIVASY